jgi:hypothetical protein
MPRSHKPQPETVLYLTTIRFLRSRKLDDRRYIWTRSEGAAFAAAKRYFAWHGTRIEIEQIPIFPYIHGLCAALTRRNVGYVGQFRKIKINLGQPTRIRTWTPGELSDMRALEVNEEERAWKHWLASHPT